MYPWEAQRAQFVHEVLLEARFARRRPCLQVLIGTELLISPGNT